MNCVARVDMAWPGDAPEAVRTYEIFKTRRKDARHRICIALELCLRIEEGSLRKPGLYHIVGADFGAFTRYCTHDGIAWTPLAYAIRKKHHSLAIEMLKHVNRVEVETLGGWLLWELRGYGGKNGRVLDALLRAGVDPNTPLDNKFWMHGPGYWHSLIACVLLTGPAAEPSLRALLDDPRLSDKIWSPKRETRPIPVEEFVVTRKILWAEEPLAEWRRWRARRAWVGAVLRATLSK